MPRQYSLLILLGVLLLHTLMHKVCEAGMPIPLPTSWTIDNVSEVRYQPGYDGSADVRWQVMSFFVAGLFLSAWGVRWLWRHLRRDFPGLPNLSYGRAVSLVLLWGLMFVLILTMISGARELMTPGAWKPQGITYKLATSTEDKNHPEDSRTQRRQALELIRTNLWQYAATHEGYFPSREQLTNDVPNWSEPGAFQYVEGCRAEEHGRMFVIEQERQDEERLVLLTNGLIGTMRTEEIERWLEDRGKQ